MAYDVNKLARLSQQKSMAEAAKTDYTAKIGVIDKKIDDQIKATNAVVAKAFKSGKVDGNTVNLYTSDNMTGDAAFSFDFPIEMVLDQAKTAFVPKFAFSEETYTGATNPKLEGKPVMVLAVKGSDNSVTYSFLNMATLVDTYTAKAGDGSATVAEKTGLTGSEKMAQVVAEMYKKVPNSLKKVLNEKQLEMIAQWIFNWMRRYADAYLDTKQNADKTDIEETLNKKTDTAVAKVTADLIMELMDLTEDALRQKAADYGIDLEGKNTKDEIVREIIRHILNV